MLNIENTNLFFWSARSEKKGNTSILIFEPILGEKISEFAPIYRSGNRYFEQRNTSNFLEVYKLFSQIRLTNKGYANNLFWRV